MFEKRRGQEEKYSSKTIQQSDIRKCPEARGPFGQSHKGLSKRIRYGAQEIREPLVQVKSDLRSIQNFHYILMDPVCVANQGKKSPDG